MTGSLLKTLSLIILFLLITSQREYSILQNQAASFTDHPERRKKLSDIPDPEEIDACGAMDFYQQNIWHKTTLNMNDLLLFPLTIGVRQ